MSPIWNSFCRQQNNKQESTLLATYFQPILEERAATWALTLLLGGAEVALFVYGGAGNGLFLAFNNSVQLMAAVTIANLWVQSGMKGRDAAFLAGALVVYDATFTLALPLMELLFTQLAELPFAPIVAWPLVEGQWVAIGLGDLIVATVFPLVLRKEIGYTAGVVALLMMSVALAGVLLLPALGLWQATFPVMVVLGPLQIGLIGFWRWWRWEKREGQVWQAKRQAQLMHTPLARATWSNTMNLMKVDGYQAVIEYDADIDMFRGEILGLNGGADFYGRTPDELRVEFRKSLQVFLEVCREKGIEPQRSYSGRFNVRVPAELHEQLAILAQAKGKSLNSLAQEALQLVVQ